MILKMRRTPILLRKVLFWGIVPLVALVVIVFDQLTKKWIIANIPLNGSYAPFPGLASYFKLVHWPNTGVAFGLFRDQGLLFVVIAVAVIIALIVYSRFLPMHSWGVRVCLGLQLGGAIGNNLIDRLRFGHVTDFLLFTLPVKEKVYMWPAWNVADGSIVVGTILLVILLLLAGDQKPAIQATAG